MAKSANNLNAVLQDTADAIRAKTGGSADLCPRDFADEIATIQTGGGVVPIRTVSMIPLADDGITRTKVDQVDAYFAYYYLSASTSSGAGNDNNLTVKFETPQGNQYKFIAGGNVDYAPVQGYFKIGLYNATDDSVIWEAYVAPGYYYRLPWFQGWAGLKIVSISTGLFYQGSNHYLTAEAPATT